MPGYENVKYVKLGINDRSYDGDKVVLTTISQTYKHPRGEISSSHNDIALLKLQDTVKINEFILPICMPTRPYYNERGIVTGFGETGRGVLSQKLMKVVLERFDHQNCKGNFEGNYNEDTMLCYGHHKQRKDSCTVSFWYLMGYEFCGTEFNLVSGFFSGWFRLVFSKFDYWKGIHVILWLTWSSLKIFKG